VSGGEDLPLLGAAHLAILGGIGGTAWLLVWMGRRFPGTIRWARYSLAGFATIIGASWYLYRFFVERDPWRWNLPLELCDLALWIAIVALLTQRQRLGELAYYWGIPGAGMALLTPYLGVPFRSFFTVIFFAGHGFIVVAALYLVGTRQLRPGPRSWLFAWLAINALAAVDYWVDVRLGVDYMYLRERPPVTSLLSFMGGWPWYILGADAVAALLFLVLQWPFRKAPGRSSGEGAAVQS
jgi:hypothetical integral membrane protein (TIGR02206 family)